MPPSPSYRAPPLLLLCARCAPAARRRPLLRPLPAAAAAVVRRAPPLRPLSQSCRRPSRRPSPVGAEVADAEAGGAAAAGVEAARATEADTDDHEHDPPLAFYALFPKTLPQGPPPRGPFDIDTRALRSEFLRLQAAAHPDFHHAAAGGDEAGEGGDEGGEGDNAGEGNGRASHSRARARAEVLSSRINEAYRTLASPLLRAQYLLQQRHGVDLAGDESTVSGSGSGSGSASGPGPGSDMELLMAVLEVREEIERAACEADLEPIRAANDARMRASERALAAAFAADDAAAARRETVRLRYWVNVDDALRNWERGKDIVLEH